MAEQRPLTSDRLKHLLAYDPSTGVFIWNVASGKARKGSRAGSLTPRGYRMIRFDGKAYQAHRLAWFYMNDAWPKKDIDHINGEPDDNTWTNLREATCSENCANRKKTRFNKSGFKGVTKYYHKWDARICVNGVKYYLGLFDTAEEAHAAYMVAARKHFGDYARAA